MEVNINTKVINDGFHSTDNNITKNLKKNNHHSLTRKNNSFVAKTNDNIEETVDTTRRIIPQRTRLSVIMSKATGSPTNYP